jgi:hypothetical protein
MFQSTTRINKTIHYFFVILVLISVMAFLGLSLPNVLNADDKVKEKAEEKEEKKEEKKEKAEEKEEKKEEKEEKAEEKEEKAEEKEEKKEEKEEKKEKDKEDKGLKTFHITSSCNNGGSISPSGNQKINEGESLAFSCSTDEGYDLIYIRVDNEKIEGIDTYTFTDVDSNHTIHARFKKIKDPAGGSGDKDDQGYEDSDFDSTSGTGSEDGQSDEDSDFDSTSGTGSEDGQSDEDSENDIFNDYNSNMIVFCGIFSILNKGDLLKIEEKNSDHVKNKKSEKSYDKKYLFDVIKINDTDQLLDISKITEKNEITEILDVDDIINEGNFIEIGQLDLNTDNPFISAFIFVWGKIKDFSYYYNT